VHVSWAPSEVTCRNEERHENVKGAGNIVSSPSGDSDHLSLNRNVCWERIYLLMRTYGLHVAYS
jgi:hypothetical protein